MIYIYFNMNRGAIYQRTLFEVESNNDDDMDKAE